MSKSLVFPCKEICYVASARLLLTEQIYLFFSRNYNRAISGGSDHPSNQLLEQTIRMWFKSPAQQSYTIALLNLLHNVLGVRLHSV